MPHLAAHAARVARNIILRPVVLREALALAALAALAFHVEGRHLALQVAEVHGRRPARRG